MPNRLSLLQQMMSHRKTASIPFRPRRGILIVDSQGLGDVVCSLPLLQSVCRWSNGQFPIYVLLQSADCFELIRAEGLDISPLYVQPFYNGLRGLVRLWTELLGKVDLIIGLPEIAEKKLMFLRCALGAKYLVGESRRSYRALMSAAVPLNFAEPFLQAVDKIAAVLGIETPLPFPRITITPAESMWADSALTSAGFLQNWPLIGIHSAATVPAKTWSAENFGAVIRFLGKRHPGLSVVSFGSSQERPHSDQARLTAGCERWLEGSGEWTIRQALAILSRCDLLISGDTGLMHMAAAVGSQTLSIFGPTSPARRAPTYQGGLAVAPDTSCHPCFRGRWTDCTCIRLIDVGRVAALAQQSLLHSRRTRLDGSSLQTAIQS